MTSDGIFLVRGNELVEMRQQPYDSESVLQELLEKYPRLLVGEQSHAADGLLLVRRELGVPDQEAGGTRWSLDHLFVDCNAVPTLVEVKRSSDARIRREVVGQMLDYAANGVLYWAPNSLRTEFERRCAEDDVAPADTLSQGLGADVEYVSFWENVERNLRSGQIRLIFVSDDIPRELRRVIEFLNEQMVRAEVIGIEVKQYLGEGGLKTLVPRVVGQTEQARSQKEPPAPPTPLATMTWDDYQHSFPHEKYAVARALFDRVEQYVSQRGLPWKSSLTLKYISFQRPGGYNVVTIILRSDSPIQFRVKLPFGFGTPQSLEHGVVDPYPALETGWDAHNHEVIWRIPEAGSVPDVGPAIELTCRYQPDSGPMSTLAR